MFGRVSAEGFEALHVLIAKLKAMSRSQTTLSRINTTNAKSQTALKPGVMETSDKFEKGSKGKKRARYNTKPSTQSTDAAETLEPYNTVTHEGGEFIEVSGGEAIVWKKAEDVWRFLTTSFTPPAWGEVFQSSTTITQEKKRKLRSGAELHLK
jgi:hypothetical protein